MILRVRCKLVLNMEIAFKSYGMHIMPQSVSNHRSRRNKGNDAGRSRLLKLNARKTKLIVASEEQNANVCNVVDMETCYIR